MNSKSRTIVSVLAVAVIVAAFGVCARAGETASDQAIRDELRRLAGTASPNKAVVGAPPAEATVEVKPLEIGTSFEKTTERFGDKIHDFNIRNGVFYIGDKPRFLIGVESRSYDGPWLLNVLGVDIQPVHNTLQAHHRAAVNVTKTIGPDGRTHFICDSETVDPWGDARIREILRGGTLTWFDWHLTMQSFWPLPYLQYRFDPPFYTPHLDGWRKPSSHFLDINMDSPHARQMYLNTVRWSQRHIRKFPVPYVELVNEVSYINPNPTNVRKFQAAMAGKYRTVAKANTAWRTEYKDFASVFPPQNIQSAMMYNSAYGVIPHGDAFRNGLWVDWIKFMQDRAYEAFEILADDYRAHDPGARITFQTPYWHGTNALTPRMFNDLVDVYGQECGMTLLKVEAGKEDWGSITRMLRQAMCLDLVARALPDKPSMNQECGVGGYPRGEYVIGPAGVRSFFWNQAVHGSAGSVISYYYSQATSSGGYSTFDPRRMKLTAMKEMPRVGNEINNVAEIILPRPRRKARVAMLFSYESMRLLRPEGRGRGGKVSDTCDIYAAAMLSGVPLEIIDNDMLLAEDLSGYKVLFIARAFRVKPGTVGKLRRFAEAGGHVVLTSDSLMLDDDTHERLDPVGLLGGKTGPAVTEKEIVNFDVADISSQITGEVGSTPLDGRDDFTGVARGFEFTPTTAQVLAATTTGKAALTVQTIGRGRVYYMAREFNGPIKRKLFKWILAQAGETPAVEAELTDGIKTNYVETQLFSKDGHHVLYAMNWGGGPRTGKLKVLKGLAGSQFYVRNLRTLQYVAPDGSQAKQAWSAEDLAGGIACELAMHDPEVFVIDVIDDAAGDALALADLPDEQKEILSWLWRQSPPSEQKILMDAFYTLEGRIHGYKMPTAVKMMEDKGYQVEYLIQPLTKMRVRTAEEVRDAQLSEFDILVLSATGGSQKHFGEDDGMPLIEQYVREGGGLLVLCVRDWHGNRENNLLQMFGMDSSFAYFHDAANAIDGESLWFKSRNIGEHPLAAGVSEIHVMGGRPISGDGVAIVSSGPDSYTEHNWGGDAERVDGSQAVVMAIEYGKGRVVAVGTDYLFRPTDMEQSDNRQLFENIIDWLAGGPAIQAPEAPAVAEAGESAEAAEFEVVEIDTSNYSVLDEVPAATPGETTAKLWTMEGAGGADFEHGRIVSGFAYTGKRSVQALRYSNNLWDCRILTRWNSDGFCVIPENAHLNFAYYTRYPSSSMVVVETPDGSAKRPTELEKGKWMWMSIPISEFQNGEGLAGKPVTTILIKAGPLGTDMEIFIDDVSITAGPLESPR